MSLGLGKDVPSLGLSSLCSRVGHCSAEPRRGLGCPGLSALSSGSRWVLVLAGNLRGFRRVNVAGGAEDAMPASPWGDREQRGEDLPQ